MRPIALLVLAASVALADDWPQFRRDPARSGASGETGVVDPLVEAWRADLPAASLILGSPVASEGYVLLGAMDGLLRCYRESDGLQVWTWTAPEPIVSTPVVQAGRVYAVDRRGTLACIELETGVVEWTQKMSGQGFSSPTLVGGRLFLGKGFPEMKFSAVDPNGGGPLWDFPTGQPSFSSPTTDGPSVWSASGSGQVFRVDATNGSQVWLDSTQGSPSGNALLLSGGALYFAPGGSDTSLYRIDAASGMPAWVTPLLFPGDPATTPAATCPEAGAFTTQVVPNWRYVSSSALSLPGGVVCVEGGIVNLRLFAVDEASGVVLWSLPAGSPDAGMPFASSPSYASGRVFVGGGGAGSLLVVDPSGTGSIVQTLPLPGVVASSPAIANGRVFVASSTGRLAAFNSAGNNPPGVVPTMTPSGGAPGTGPNPTLSWGAASDAGPGADPSPALRYLVRWDNDGEVLKDFDGEVLTGAGVLTQALGAYPEDTVVTWRVRTLDTQGAWSPWSASASFPVFYPWRLQGRVTRGGVGVAGVNVVMTGSGSGTAVTDANGFYNFYSMGDGSYTLTFSLFGYSFTPGSIDVTVAGGHQTGLDTTGTLLGIFAVRGRVLMGVAGVPGVRVDVTGDGVASATTDANGNYAVTGLTIGSFTATPSAYGLVFSPVSRAVVISSGDATGQDFVATRSGSGEEEIVLGLGNGASGWLQGRGGAASGYPVVRWFRVLWPRYDTAVGATHPALGDLDGDGLDEVVVGLGSYPAAGGWVAIYDDGLAGHRLLRWFRVPYAAYNAANGETWPACGNFDADSRSEIALGLGTNPSNGGWTLLVDDYSAGLRPLQWARAGQLDYVRANGASYPAAGDVDGDGRDDLVVGFGPGGGGLVSILTAAGGYRVQRFARVPWDAYDAQVGATRPACGNLDGDARDEIAVGLQGPLANGQWGVFDDQATTFSWLLWRQVPWTAYNTAVGTTRPAVADLDGDGRDEVAIGLGPYTTSGGFLYSWDDGTSGMPLLGPWNVGWPAYNAANGESFPAGGETR